MAATIARSIMAVRSTGATALLILPRRLLYSTVSNPPPLPGLARLRISTARFATPALSHSLRVIHPTMVNSVRCRVTRPRSAYSPHNSGSNQPLVMEPRFAGSDYGRWLIILDRPVGEDATKQMIDYYTQTLAKVLGSEEEAKRKIYYLSRYYFGFGCEIDEETSNKLKGLPGVRFVLPDSYFKSENKDYIDDRYMFDIMSGYEK